MIRWSACSGFQFVQVVLVCTFAALGTSVFAEENPGLHSADRLFFGKNKTYDTNEDSVERGVVLLDFYNDACGPCRSMMPAVNSLIQRGFRVSKVNTDKFPEWASRFNITKIPCFVVCVDGHEVARHVGVTSENKLESLIVQAGGSPNIHPQPLHSEEEQIVQVADSAWMGREVKVTVQEIVAGNYVFGNETTETAGNSQFTAGSTGSQNSSLREAVAKNDSEGGLNWKPASMVSANGTQSSTSLNSRLLSSTVRIRVNDAQGEGCGTGTLIDCRSGHALILTCGHLFHEYKKGDSIQVDLFTESGTITFPARYVNHDEERDLGLISLSIQNKIQTSPVAALNQRLDRGMKVCTVGCSYGAEPTIQTGVITSLNRFLGTPNIEVSAVPVQGRSGGGMFTENGELIGVCFAANPDDQEGLFTSLTAIYDYFRELRMEQFVVSPRNESQENAAPVENSIVLRDLPPSESAAQVSASGLKQAEPIEISLADSNTVEPIYPTSTRLTNETPKQGTLTGETSPNWPPKWNE